MTMAILFGHWTVSGLQNVELYPVIVGVALGVAKMKTFIVLSNNEGTNY